MTLSTPQRYDVRTATSADLPLLRRWVGQPHWREWWGDPEKAVAEISAALESIETEPLIVELDGKAVAYIQSYDPHLADGHPYQDQPFGTLGLDISIGPAELLGNGHGPAILTEFTNQLFEEGCVRVIVDPDPSNKRAIRAYQKAGFVVFDERTSELGPALMMALDAPE